MQVDRDVSARSNDTGWLDTRSRSRAKLPRCRLYPTGLRHRRVLSFFLSLSHLLSLSFSLAKLLLLYFAEMRSNGRPLAKFVAASTKLDERSRALQLCFFLPNKVLDSTPIAGVVLSIRKKRGQVAAADHHQEEAEVYQSKIKVSARESNIGEKVERERESAARGLESRSEQCKKTATRL